jgi:hypothetical protein
MYRVPATRLKTTTSGALVHTSARILRFPTTCYFCIFVPAEGPDNTIRRLSLSHATGPCRHRNRLRSPHSTNAKRGRYLQQRPGKRLWPHFPCSRIPHRLLSLPVIRVVRASPVPIPSCHPRTDARGVVSKRICRVRQR